MKMNAKLMALGLMVLALVAVLGGCTTFTSTVPSASIPLERAEYTILGETSAEAKGSLILGFIWSGDNHFGQIGGSDFSFNFDAGLENTKQNALYKALQQMPEADAVIAPKYDIQVNAGLFANDYIVKVTATGIKLKEGPVAKIK